VLVLSAPGASAGTATTLRQLVGQTIMTRLAGTQPSAALLARIRAGEVGGVIFFRWNITSEAAVTALVRRLQDEAAAGGNPPLLIAVDQEGGIVRRLPGPPERSASAMGTQSTASIRAEGEATGRYLRELGIDVDLAPVFDTPVSRASFIYRRSFSMDPAQTARAGSAFVRGLQLAGVAATAKHFPGLGTARITTDARRVVILRSRSDLDRRLRPFVAAVGAGVKLVMVANAAYPAYDPSAGVAALSPSIVGGLLRGRLGFDGVVITDALEAPGPSAYPQAGVAAIKAGVDVLLYTGEADSSVGFDQVLAAVRQGSLPASTLRLARERIVALKAWLARG
jgi:beta-N-acetylhexosaminidase